MSNTHSPQSPATTAEWTKLVDDALMRGTRLMSPAEADAADRYAASQLAALAALRTGR